MCKCSGNQTSCFLSYPVKLVLPTISQIACNNLGCNSTLGTVWYILHVWCLCCRSHWAPSAWPMGVMWSSLGLKISLKSLIPFFQMKHDESRIDPIINEWPCYALSYLGRSIEHIDCYHLMSVKLNVMLPHIWNILNKWWNFYSIVWCLI